MKGKLGQYTGSGGVMAILLLLFNHVDAIEGLTPNMELAGKSLVGLLAIGVTLYLQSRKPPGEQKSDKGT